MKIGDRVFYTEHGPDDTGIVTGVLDSRCHGGHRLYRVAWDDGSFMFDLYTEGQLTEVCTCR